jgi:hypothetical protein
MKILIFNWRDTKIQKVKELKFLLMRMQKDGLRRGMKLLCLLLSLRIVSKEEFVNGVRIVRAGGKYSVYKKAKEYYKKYFSKENFDVVIDEINKDLFSPQKFVKNGEKIIALIHQLAKNTGSMKLLLP